MVPQYGCRFEPTDEEIMQMLQRKASGHEISMPFLLQMDVYKQDPQDLGQWDEAQLGVRKHERYYYYKKKNESREVSGLGWWKATSHVKKIYANDQQTLVGCKRPFAFHRFSNKDRNRYNAVKTNYIIHEYSLHGSTPPTDWRLCKMRYKGKLSIQEEVQNMSRKSDNNSLSKDRQDQAGGSNNVNAQQDLVGDVEKQKHSIPAVAEYSTAAIPTENSVMQDQVQQPVQTLDDPSYLLPSDGYKYDAQEQLFDLTDPSSFSSLWSWQP